MSAAAPSTFNQVPLKTKSGIFGPHLSPSDVSAAHKSNPLFSGDKPRNRWKSGGPSATGGNARNGDRVAAAG
ncbi:hypothetical protein GWI33_006676 [Rhynchophorus ferrugineus]|uniref:Uncharacterized protein n=1 Tax=Rhynchophorus ferrugineus TaxID=354439 RepID=A0A834MFA4_RHYFE|nr:hypothetical protein GWI33_006676 [Rhynchophorus ferrugineus]